MYLFLFCFFLIGGQWNAVIKIAVEELELTTLIAHLFSCGYWSRLPILQCCYGRSPLLTNTEFVLPSQQIRRYPFRTHGSRGFTVRWSASLKGRLHFPMNWFKPVILSYIMIVSVARINLTTKNEFCIKSNLLDRITYYVSMTKREVQWVIRTLCQESSIVMNVSPSPSSPYMDRLTST